MTPYWLSKHAEISGSYSVHPDHIEISTGGVTLGRLIRVQLAPPRNLSKEDDVTVTITVAMDTVYAHTVHHDPYFGINDGENFVSFRTLSSNFYSSYPPCVYTEAMSTVDRLTSRVTSHSGVPRPTVVKSYSSEVKMHIKPTEKWGSCHTEHDEGHIVIAQYSYKLDITKGLYFDMYRDNTSETYRIVYILVKVS